MSPNLNNPKEISEAGERLYSSKYKADFEKKYAGQFVAINVVNGEATIGPTASETLIRAKAENPVGIFHLIRVGHSGAFEVGLAYRNATTARLPGL